MRIAVTGAAGRLGRHVVARAVRAGHEVVAADLPGAVGESDGRVEWRAADLTDLDAVRAALAGAQGVIHLGGLTHPRYPEPEVHRTNVDGTHHVLVAAEEHGLEGVCLASSVNAIGGVFSAAPRYDYFPVTRSTPRTARTPTACRSGCSSSSPRRSRAAVRTCRSPRCGCTPCGTTRRRRGRATKDGPARTCGAG